VRHFLALERALPCFAAAQGTHTCLAPTATLNQFSASLVRATTKSLTGSDLSLAHRTRTLGSPRDVPPAPAIRAGLAHHNANRIAETRFFQYAILKIAPARVPERFPTNIAAQSIISSRDP
jgi:hypothetical protein